MLYALITGPGLPHCLEVGPAEIFFCFITVRFSTDLQDFDVYFHDEVLLFETTTPSIMSSAILVPGPTTVM